MQEFLNLKTIKIALFAALFLVASVLFFKWQMVNAPLTDASAQSSSNPAVNPADNAPPNLPSSQNSSQTSPPLSPITQENSDSLISVNTPLMQVKIDPNDGKIVAATLNQYKEELGQAQNFKLLDQNQNGLYYVVNSGLVASDNSLPTPMRFTSVQSTYTLNGESQLNVNLTWQNTKGLKIVKTFSFFPNNYTVGVNYTIMNGATSAWSGRFYGELTRNLPVSEKSLLNSYTNYTGAAISSPDDHYEKVKFTNMAETNLSQTAASGWVAMLQHYFITAWVPGTNTSITQFSAVNNGLYSIGLALPSIDVAPGQSVTTGATLYAGPAIAEQLKTTAPYLDKTVDYGWLWFISELIFTVMKWIHSYVGNWGLAIILVTCLIKLVFYPLSAKSYHSMAKMRELQPKVKALREKVGDDRQKLGMATMELYRKEKVNPLGGCLPILVQIPVFIALYWVLMESVELRQAPFLGWIHDLSARDPYFILPVLMGISMFIQQRLNPAPPDPMQAKIMMFLPVVFTVMFLGFPSGLVLYWLVNNCLSILQQWWVLRRYRLSVLKKT